MVRWGSRVRFSPQALTKFAIYLVVGVVLTILSMLITSQVNECSIITHNGDCDYGIGFPIAVTVVSDAPINHPGLSVLVFVIDSIFYATVAKLLASVYVKLAQRKV